jgi:hypothetical protein
VGSAVTFGEDVDFLRRHTETVVLSDARGATQVAICPALQGRVAVSTTGGQSGPSFGWINRALIASGKLVPHMNVFGGADRFWLGPEGGQFSFFFPPGAPQDLAHWQTPAPIDSEPFELVDQAQDHVILRKSMRLTNASGTEFDLKIEREVRLTKGGFESRNRVTNTGTTPWRHESGLVSIWIAGTFAPSPATVIVLPYRLPPDSDPGQVVQSVVNDHYFGRVAPHRLLVKERAVYFRGDGQSRAKLGIRPCHAQPALGSYDPDAGLLTLVHYTLAGGTHDYVNSLWEHQPDPYAGDVVNAYNDGPATPGAAPFGPFYELETSSPALALAPGESFEHVHRTVHHVGAPEHLEGAARSALGVGIDEIAAAFSGVA